MAKNRIEESYRARMDAAEMARARAHPRHDANPDEQRYASAHYPMSFTKGLHHDPALGVVKTCAHFEAFRAAIDEGYVEPFTTRVPVPVDKKCRRRQWEAPTAGVVYDLQGPDAQAVTMAPAPALCSDELAFEMAEVYELALLRDVPLTSFDAGGGAGQAEIDASIARLNALPYAADGFTSRPRVTEAGALTRQTVFRGSSPGVEVGPYVSQLMWIGNGDPAEGVIAYGPQCIDQKVRVAKTGLDYMQIWEDWYRVQQGFDVNHCGAGKGNEKPCGGGQSFETGKKGELKRFICTPRDLATYVHVDALYQAYLNAALILLGMRTPFDPGFAKLSGMREVFAAQPGMAPITTGALAQNAGGFALYGGPHILTLVTEVATRALKAVRYQKFNTHLRLRPEALGGRLEKATELDAKFPALCSAFTKMCDDIGDTLHAVKHFNKKACGQDTKLLPMAFAEGSPMHPTYGAGHATVAGACVTVLKAYFDTGALLGAKDDPNDPCVDENTIGFHSKICEAVCYEPDKEGYTLHRKEPDCPLTLEGELNKLAANISIGRNMAGVHYFSDYYDSLRMGEEIAIGMLQEQALCYPTDEFVMSVPTFDGDLVRIGRK